MGKVRNKKSLYLGVILVAIAILFNTWLVGIVLAPSGQISRIADIVIIVIFQIVTLSIGLYLLIKQPLIQTPDRKELVLIVSSVIVTFLMLEIGAGIWLQHLATQDQYNKYVLITDTYDVNLRYTPHHYLNYYTTPNYKSGLTSHNSLGYRGKEFPQDKPDGVYRIVTLGGSSTYCTGIEDNEKTFQAQLEKVLSDEYGYQNVQVINAGVGGYNSWESLINLEFRVLDIEPDLIIVYHGTNEVHARLVLPSAYHGDNSGRRKQWSLPDCALWEHSCILRILSRRLGFTHQFALGHFVNAQTAHAGGEPSEVLKENPPIYFERNLKNMIAIAKEHNIKIIFATWAYSPYFEDYASTSYFQQGFKENNEVAREVTNNHEIPLLDFAVLMPKDKRYWVDGRHVNEEGALLKARLFAEFVDKNGLIPRQ